MSINQEETTTTTTPITIIIVGVISQVTTRRQAVDPVATDASKITSTLINMHTQTHTIKRLKMTTIITMGSSRIANITLLQSLLGRKVNSFQRMNPNSQKTMKKKRSLSLRSKKNMYLLRLSIVRRT
jgi:hypothetical protein